MCVCVFVCVCVSVCVCDPVTFYVSGIRPSHFPMYGNNCAQERMRKRECGVFIFSRVTGVLLSGSEITSDLHVS